MHAMTPSKIRAAFALPTIALGLTLSPNALPAPRFALEPRVGYAHAMTTGLSPYGAFAGLGLRVLTIEHLWLSTSVNSYVGSRAAGDGPSLTYRARDRAYDGCLDATWRFEVSRWAIEPGVEVGAAWIVGYTYVTPARITDSYVAGNVGPVLRSSWALAGSVVGMEAAALYVPSNPAAPILRGGVFVALPL